MKKFNLSQVRCDTCFWLKVLKGRNYGECMVDPQKNRVEPDGRCVRWVTPEDYQVGREFHQAGLKGALVMDQGVLYDPSIPEVGQGRSLNVEVVGG